MRTPRHALVPILVTAAILLTGCGPGPGDLDDGDAILGDDLDLDSYHVEGSIDGLTWVGDLCALNLIPSFPLNAKGKEGPNDQPYYGLQFEAYDKEITGGVVKGIWRLNDDINHPVQINSGTWSAATSAGAQEPGTISVELQVTEYLPAGGSNDRTVTGALNLSPVITSEEWIAMNNVDDLKSWLETYEGPTGDGM